MDRVAAMQSFVHTVERGSFAAAAAGRGLSATMVGNHIRFLEARLGALLLNRTTRQQHVTEFGRSYYERCRAILAEIEAAETAAEAVQSVSRGLLRVTAPVTLGTTVLPALLAGYLSRNQAVRVDLVLQDHRLDLLADELDVAIRAGALPDSSLMARALPPLQLVVCAAPVYLAAHGTPATPADLALHNCLDFAHAAEPLLWRFSGEGGEVAVGVNGNLRINSGPALRAAALQGIGIVMQPEIVVADDLAAGRLVHLLADHAAPALKLHLLTLPNRRPTPKLRGFIEYVAAELGRSSRAGGRGAQTSGRPGRSPSPGKNAQRAS